LLTPTGAFAQTLAYAVRVGAAHVGFRTKADVQVNGTLVRGKDASASNTTTLGRDLSNDITPQWTNRFFHRRATDHDADRRRRAERNRNAGQDG